MNELGGGAKKSGTTANRIARGAVLLYAASMATNVVQFAYAALTSRLVGADGFGYYAIALTSAALVSTVSTGPVSAVAGRLENVSRASISTVWKLTAGFGAASGLLMLVLAPVWAAVWAAPEALPALQFVAVNSAVAPFAAAGMALMRRAGDFRKLAAVIVSANALGMSLGAIAVYLLPNAATLLISSLVSQSAMAVMFAIQMRRHAGEGTGDARARKLGSYVSTIGMGRVLAYFTGFVGKFAVGHAVGIAAVGQWNRADALSSVPLQQVQGAMVQSLYPEFRHDIDTPVRAQRVWTDLLIMLATAVWPAIALAAVGAYVALPLLFGPGWLLAQQLVFIFALSGAIQISTAALASAVEALGVRRWLLIEQLVALSVQVAGAAVTLVSQSIVPAVVALPLSLLAQHLVDLCIASRRGYLSLRRVLSHYMVAAVVALIVIVGAGIIAYWAAQLGAWVDLLALVGFAIALGGIAWILRERIPAFKLAQLYGIVR